MQQPPFHLPELSAYKRKQLTGWAMQALEAQQALQAQGGVHQLMLRHADAAQFIANAHYPKGDRIDYASGAQYFYHCHREDMDIEEHGHFHCFIRRAGWPKSWRLADIPEADKYLNNPMTHVVAIGLNRVGQPIRLFMVNRWVSKECWFDADKMRRLLPRYRLAITKDPHWQVVDCWVEGLIQLFAPQISWLYDARDREMARRVAADPAGDPYHDRQIEEIAALPISLEAQVGWLMQQEQAA